MSAFSSVVNGPVPIRGLKADNYDRPPMRMELRDMKKNRPKQFELYLLGLERFKNTNEYQDLSYFQIAGIHGIPHQTWPKQKWKNDLIPGQDSKGLGSGGFCAHSSILFLPWHRPYLALFETELHKHVKAVAESYGSDENRDAYIEEAKNFRMPYWDWALPQDNNIDLFPAEATANARHEVTMPGSKGERAVLKPNPLASYEFGENGTNYEELNGWGGSTVRQPYFQDDKKVKAIEQDFKSDFFPELLSDDERRQLGIQKGKNLTERIHYILTSYNDFGQVSNNRFSSIHEGSGSLEDIHNSVHTYVGGGGHMGNADIAAFDPIFWLHHTNIDRLFAIWQALHEDPNDKSTYVQPSKSSGASFATPAYSEETAESPLYPFNASIDGQDWWTADRVRSTKEFGYVYPETRNWEFSSIAKIKDELNRIYKKASLASVVKSAGESRRAAKRSLQARALDNLKFETTALTTTNLIVAADQGPQAIPQQVVAQMAAVELPPERHLQDLLSPENTYLEWLVNVRSQKHTRGGNFVIHFFLGTPEEEANSHLYLFNPNHVAAYSTFGREGGTGCAKCQQDQAKKLIVTGQIPLTIALVERYLAGLLNSLTPEDVIPFLKENLHWRATSLGGDALDLGQVEDLLVAVVTNEVSLSTDHPEYAPTVEQRLQGTTDGTLN